MDILLQIIKYISFIPMIILQYYMSIILFPIIICGCCIWKYRKKNKKIMILCILSHLFGLLSLIITKILASGKIDIHYSVENVLIIAEEILVILFAIFALLAINKIINLYDKQYKENKNSFKQDILKLPTILSAVTIIIIMIGFIYGSYYKDNFIGRKYEEFSADNRESYTISFKGTSLGWIDSTGNEKYCEDMMYLYNPFTRKLDLYCFEVYETSIKIIEAEPEKLIIKEPRDGFYLHCIKKDIDQLDSKNNPEYLVGRKFKDKSGETYYFKNKTKVIIDKYTTDYYLVDFNDNYPELIIIDRSYTYNKARDKIMGLKEIK